MKAAKEIRSTVKSVKLKNKLSLFLEKIKRRYEIKDPTYNLFLKMAEI